jgi:hypothetical protein
MRNYRGLILLFAALIISSLLFGCSSENIETAQEGINASPDITSTAVADVEEADTTVPEETDVQTESDNENVNEQETEEPDAQEPSAEETDAAEEELEDNQMKLIIGEYTLTATMADNSSAKALLAMLEKGPKTIDMRDYANMEKVGSLGTSLPENNEQITTQAGDLILYQGSALVIYYAPNSWNFTRLGKIDDITQEELIEVLGDGAVQVTLALD